MFSKSQQNKANIEINFIGRNHLLVVKKDNCTTIVARAIMRSSHQLAISSPRATTNNLSGPIAAKYSAKEVVLDPNYQSGRFLDYHQGKYWIVLSGMAVIAMQQETKLLSTEQSIFIPAMCEHQIKNIGQEQLTLVEFRAIEALTGDEKINFIAGPTVTSLAV